MKFPRVPQRMTPGVAFSMVDRALRDCLAKRQFGKAEIEQVLEFFNKDIPECVFCGNKDVKRWDHLIPIRNGGETVLGNMVLACTSCDDSKRDLFFEEWMASDFKKSPKSKGIKDTSQRIKRIKAYMRNFSYTPQRLEERLNKQELRRLNENRSRLKKLRKDVDALIEDYRARMS